MLWLTRVAILIMIYEIPNLQATILQQVGKNESSKVNTVILSKMLEALPVITYSGAA